MLDPYAETATDLVSTTGDDCGQLGQLACFDAQTNTPWCVSPADDGVTTVEAAPDPEAEDTAMRCVACGMVGQPACLVANAGDGGSFWCISPSSEGVEVQPWVDPTDETERSVCEGCGVEGLRACVDAETGYHSCSSPSEDGREISALEERQASEGVTFFMCRDASAQPEAEDGDEGAKLRQDALEIVRNSDKIVDSPADESSQNASTASEILINATTASNILRNATAAGKLLRNASSSASDSGSNATTPPDGLTNTTVYYFPAPADDLRNLSKANMTSKGNMTSHWQRQLRRRAARRRGRQWNTGEEFLGEKKD